VGVLLRIAWLLHRDRMYERLAAAGYPDVTPAQFALLRYPGVDGMRPSDAAELAGISKQTVNDLLGELERGGYLERKPHPEDGRGRIVRLTSRGKRLQRAAVRIGHEVEAAWAAEVGPERIASLKETLAEMVASASNQRPSASP
jgi:DNA-binding MarR family transcriptional regulator